MKALILAIFLVSFSSALYSLESKAPDDKLQNEMFDSIKNQINSKLSPDAEKYLKELIANGIEKIAKEGYQKSKMNEAENSIRKIITEINSRREPELNSQKLKSLMKGLCPIFPFC